MKNNFSDRRQLRIATYNVHKCRGLDGRTRPARIAEVLRELDADVVALQEVVSITDGLRHENQSAFLAGKLGYDFRLGSTRALPGRLYGNVVLSRFPIAASCHYNLSVPRREPRGCLRTDLVVDEETSLHVFNVHLGTAFRERRRQGKILVGADILDNSELAGPRIMLGDFNEWTRGLTSRLLVKHLNRANLKLEVSWRRTYPGVLPVLDLDHVYHDSDLQIQRFRPHRSRLSLIASDHLPLVADFRLALPSQSVAA